jgi:hypothetical protein
MGCSLFFSFDQKAMLFIFSTKCNDNTALFLKTFTIFRKFFNCGNCVCIRFGTFYCGTGPWTCVAEVCYDTWSFPVCCYASSIFSFLSSFILTFVKLYEIHLLEMQDLIGALQS